MRRTGPTAHLTPRRNSAGRVVRRGSGEACRTRARPRLATPAPRPAPPRTGPSWPGPAPPPAASRGPSPGKVSPRRTAKPRSRSAAATASAPGSRSSTNGPGRRAATSDARQRAQPGQQMRPVRGDPRGRLRRLGQRPGRAAGLGRHQRGAGHRPQRLGALQRGDRVRRRPARSRPAARRAPTSWSGCAAPPAPAGRVRAGQRLPLAGHRVHERLVHHQGPARAGPAAASASAGCSTEVGLVGLPTTTRSASSGTAAGSSRKPSAARQQHPPHRVPRVAQCRLRLGELRVHHHRAAGPQRAGEQHERLRGARPSAAPAPPAARAARRPPGAPPGRPGRRRARSSDAAIRA